MIMIRLFVCLTLFIICHGSLAQQVKLADKGGPHVVAHPYYLEDQKGQLTFEEAVKNENGYIRSELIVPDFLGSLSKVIWYRFEVTNSSSIEEWFLEIKGGYMHTLTLYQINNDGSVKTQQLSSDDQFAKRPVKSNNVVFPVQIAIGEKSTFYLRATSRSLIRASMSFNTMQQLYENSVYTSYGNGFLTALAVALLLYNLFLYFSLKERVYLYYILYISLYILHNNIVSGNTLAFLPWTNILNSNILLPLMGFSSILFTNSFLQTKKYAPFIYRIRWILSALYLIPLTIYFAGSPQLAIVVISTLMYLLFIYWFSAGIIAYRNSFKPAIYYIAGFGALIICNTTFGLKINGVIQEGYWIDSALYIGTALESIILSFALAKKINFYKQEKESIQEQAYQQAVTFSHELITMQETERKRIASELHDSVGQKLIVIKNKVLLSLKTNGENKKPDHLAENVADVIQEIRSISYGLRPYQIDLLGLTQSVKSLAEETFEAAGINYEMHADNIDTLLDADSQMNIYRIIQECLNNIVKHSRASKCSINIYKNNQQIAIKIKDDGIGYREDDQQKGFGLRGIKERLHILRGTINAESADPTGTITTIQLPLPPANN